MNGSEFISFSMVIKSNDRKSSFVEQRYFSSEDLYMEREREVKDRTWESVCTERHSLAMIQIPTTDTLNLLSDLIVDSSTGIRTHLRDEIFKGDNADQFNLRVLE